MNLNKMIVTSIVGITAVTGAFATVEDYETVTSKQYTDTKFQEKIAAHASGANPSLLTDSAIKGVVEKRAIFDGTGNEITNANSSHIPTVGAMISAINNGVTNGTATFTWNNSGAQEEKTPTEGYSVTFDDETAGAWPEEDETKLVNGHSLANALALKQNKIDGTASQYAESLKYADGSLVETTGNGGVVTQRGIATSRNTDTNGVLLNGDWVPTVDMLISEAESAAATAATSAVSSITGTPGSIVTYDVHGYLADEVSIDTTVTSGSSNIPTSGAVYTAVDAKQDKKECVEWVKFDSSLPNGYQTYNVETTGAHCWLWDFPSV